MFYCLPSLPRGTPSRTGYTACSLRGFAAAHAHPGWRSLRALTPGYRACFPAENGCRSLSHLFNYINFSNFFNYIFNFQLSTFN
jgi:hypothetical protein